MLLMDNLLAARAVATNIAFMKKWQAEALIS